MTLLCRGVRGATITKMNSKDAIVEATQEVLQSLLEVNDVNPDDIAAVWFTTTVDINAEFPAVAARKLGLTSVALLCAHEMDVPDGARGVIRLLMLINTNKSPQDLKHVYLRGAENLRKRGVD